MIVELTQPHDLLTRDTYGMSQLLTSVRKHIYANHPKTSIARYKHKVALNFLTEEDAIMFHLVYSESL